MRRLLPAALAILLASCAMGPDYERPTVPVQKTWRMAAQEGESIANMPWWELLSDDELQTLVRIALEGNKDLQRAVASVDEFRARLFVARTDLFARSPTSCIKNNKTWQEVKK